MRTLKAYIDKTQAVTVARNFQRTADRSTLLGVERDMWKAPYEWRVVSFDLNNHHDRAMLGPPGTVRVNGVTRTMFARRLSLIVGVPRVTLPETRAA